jgi:hypothetical protein
LTLPFLQWWEGHGRSFWWPEVERWLKANYAITPSSVTIKSFHLEDLLVSSFGDISRILHQPPSSSAVFSLVLKRWHRQLQASADKLLFWVMVLLVDIPAHAWSVSMASQALGLSCPSLKPTPSTIAKSDLRWFVVHAWCIHHDLIPRETLLYIPEPDLVHVRGRQCS